MKDTSFKKNLAGYFVIVTAVLACAIKVDGQMIQTGVDSHKMVAYYNYELPNDYMSALTSNFSATPSSSKLIPNKLLHADQLLFCNDLFEPNDSRPQAWLIQPIQVYQGLISTALDIDWFKFTLTAPQPNVRVTLFNLPANYNLFLYNPGNAKIGLSKNKSADGDTITVNGLASGTYYIKIRGKAGKSDPYNCYSLKVETSAAPFRETSVGDDFMIADSRFELYPNPVSDQLIIQSDEKISSVIFSIYNLMGQKISETNAVLDEMLKATLDVTNLNAGEYFLQIRYDQGAEIKKFVVSK